jgi:hypothetical protein
MQLWREISSTYFSGLPPRNFFSLHQSLSTRTCPLSLLEHGQAARLVLWTHLHLEPCMRQPADHLPSLNDPSVTDLFLNLSRI